MLGSVINSVILIFIRGEFGHRDTQGRRLLKAEAEIGIDVAANQGVPRIAGNHQSRRDKKKSFPTAWRGNMVLLTS